jgi:electron transport complex protein RnfD
MDAKLIISLSPHIHSGKSVERCMWNVVIALIPTLITAIWVFGPSALLVLALSVLSCMLTEWVIDRYVLHCPSTLYNGS